MFDDLTLSLSILQKFMEFSRSVFYRTMSDIKVEAIDPLSPRPRFDIPAIRKIFSTMLLDKKPVVDKINVFYNFKGGTGKTTICYQMACILSLAGFNVLVIDLDPQAHLTSAFRFDEGDEIKTAYDLLVNGAELEECIYQVYEGLDIIPSNLELTRIEVPLSQKTRREELLLKFIEPTKENYDFILIDTNPAISTLNVSALFAADKINIICETHPFSLNGLCILIEELEKIFFDLQKKLNFKVIANKYEAKTATAQEVLGVLRSDYGEEMMNSVIRKCEDINLSSKKKLPVWAFSQRKSVAVEDLTDLFKEFIAPSCLMLKR